MKAGRLPRRLEREIEHHEDVLGEVAVLELLDEQCLERTAEERALLGVAPVERRQGYRRLEADLAADLAAETLMAEAVQTLQRITRQKLEEVRMGYLWPEIALAQRGAVSAMLARRKSARRTELAGVAGNGPRREDVRVLSGG